MRKLDQKATGRAMRDRREALGLTQTDVADRVGITQQQYARYEAGAHHMQAGRIFEIADVLGCVPSNLVVRTDGDDDDQ